MMAETRVVPSGKVYRHMFDAQVHLSLSIHETRRRRAANAGCLSGDDPLSRDTDTGTQEHPLRNHTGAQQCSEDITIRNQLFSGLRPVQSGDQDDSEEIRGLPDKVVSAKTGSDIIERLTEKKQRDHMEAIAQLQNDLSVLSMEYEQLFIQTGEDFIFRLSEYDDKVERLLQETKSFVNFEAFSYQDLHEFWAVVSCESVTKRKCIHELDETLLKYETERASQISALLRKYTLILKKISYVMPCDVHRLIDNEAMMINQALLANRRAVAKLHLNLMEKHLQKDVSYHLRWEAKLQDWKKIKMLSEVNQFKSFIGSPEIQNPSTVQDTLNSMQTTQQIYSEQRLRVLEQIRAMTPPKCTKPIAAEWYLSLCSIDEQIDSLHSGTMTKLRKSFEDTGQVCLSEIECFRNKVSTYGFTANEIQEIVNAELLPLIDKFQTQSEEQLAAMDRAIEDSAKTAGIISKSLFKFLHGAAELWEEHSAKLQKTDQHLQDLLDEVRYSYEQQNQKKEAQLDLLMDKLRQESTEDTLKTALEKTLTFLEEVKNGYVALYKAEVETVESYPAMVLKELNTYSSSVSRYFFVKEVYTQNHEELQILYPSLMFDARHTSNMKKKRLSVHLEKKPCSNVQTDRPQTHSSLDFAPTDEEPDCSRQESRHFQANETFITTKGNVYNCQAFLIQSDYEVTLNNMKLEQAFYPKTLIIELQKDVREEFFNHLEQRYHLILNDTVAIMEAKRQELKSELDLRLHLHKPRTRRIEMDIHNVRATELILHRDRVDRHCKGILQTLTDFQNDFKDLQAYQHTLKKEFHTKISKMEETLITATKSDKLVKLSTSLQTSLVDHMDVIQKSQRQFRQNLEIKFEGLREANAQLMKSFKLFSEGGNFTPKEIENYQKRLEKVAKRIDLADEALMQDMEVTESKSLEQAKEIISKAEEKCQCLTVDLIFLEKIQRVLTNTQVKIKAEVMKSNMQKKTINSRMAELEEMLDAYSQPCPDKRAVTSDDVFNLTTYLIEELRKRCQYLNCYLDLHMAVPVPDTPLQGAFAVAARPRSRMQEKIKNPDEDSLLQPSRMGTAFVDDAALGVIKGLLRISKPQANQMVSGDLGEKGQTAVTVPVAPSSPPGSGQKSARCWISSGVETLHRRSAESVNSLSVKRLSKPTRFDKRFQVFGSKPEAQQKLVTFKVFITSILWEANDGLLRVAEDYYKKKERRPISRPQYIQDTFEQCAEELNKRLLVYQSQTEEYHSGCVQEFQQQLKTIEKFVSQVPEALLTKVRDQHLVDLNQNMKLIHQQFEMSEQQSEQKKKEHSRQLRVRLSHPACEEELNRLVTAEDNRHDEQKTAIQSNRLELQACIMKNADEFVTVLATLTENLLFQLDNILMPSEVQGGLVVSKQEKITPLIHHRQAGTLQKDKDVLFERGSRTWPGIHYYKATNDSSENQQQRETASITTAKTTMAHLQAIEVRNALHQSYEQTIMKELEKVQKFSQEQEAELLRWQTHWQDQLKTLSSLNSG